MLVEQENTADPNSLFVAKVKKPIKMEICGRPRDQKNLRSISNDDDEVESGQQTDKKRKKSIFVQLWMYLKDSWLGAMSGTGELFVSKRLDLFFIIYTENLSVQMLYCLKTYCFSEPTKTWLYPTLWNTQNDKI